MDAQKTGQFLSALRRARGWTQKDLAQQIGVTDKAVSRWETGRGFPDVSCLPALADALSVSVSELLQGERIVLEDKKPAELLAQMDQVAMDSLRCARQQRLVRREAVGMLLLFGVFFALLLSFFLYLTQAPTLQLYALLNLVLFPFGTPLLLHLFPTRNGGQFRPRRVLLSLLITSLLFFLSTAFLCPAFYWDLTSPEMIRYDFNDTSIDDTLILLLVAWLVALSSNLLCYAAHLWHRGFCAQNPSAI